LAENQVAEVATESQQQGTRKITPVSLT